VGFIIAPRLNAAGRLAHALRGVELLTSDSEHEANAIARDLEELNARRQELDRATIVSQADPASVQMGSSVRFIDHGSGKVHEIRLVYPVDSSLADGRLSVLTPVGSALLGQQAGSTALCRSPGGQVRPLTVVSVTPPADARAAP